MTLSDFRPGAAKAPAKRKKAEWMPPTVADLAYGQVLAFDPSLSATGFVAVSHTPDSLKIITTSTFKGAVLDGATGWERDMAVAEDLEDQMTVLATHYSRHEWQVTTEAPPMGGGVIRSPESALLACKTIRSVFRSRGFTLTPMQSPQAHKKATVGNSMIKKPEHHRLLIPMLTALGIEGLGQITNEAKRDAVSVAVAELIRRTR